MEAMMLLGFSNLRYELVILASDPGDSSRYNLLL